MESLDKSKEAEQLPPREWLPSTLQIRQYAEASGDFNPIHLDEQYAQELGLGGVIAHGMLTMAQCAAMVTDWMGDRGVITGLSVRFEGMARPGERICFKGFMRSRRGNEVELELIALKDGGERLLSGFALIHY